MDNFSQELMSAGFGEAIKVLTEHLLNSNWSRDKDGGRELLHQFNEEIIREKYLSQHVANVLKIRTLHKSDYDTQLDKIYYPLTLYTASNHDKITVNNGLTIEHRGIVNIIGIAGQGKSTILRKLFSEEIRNGKRIPFFIELRNVEMDDILGSYKTILKNIGFALEHDNGEMLLQSGKVVLMLDGFDEVKHDSRIRVMNSIRELNQRYNCPVIVTSRPNTQIHTETGIYNLYIENLILNDKLGILKVLSNDIEYSKLSELIKTNISLQHTIANPILVTLLYYCYPYWDKAGIQIISATLMDEWREVANC
ncbi:NACHT domain-containing protein [Aeromonas rivipollensis]|uniref:NACHT domain-containing protein n=1 Tax=Aeromonas rivipollensis TaxID=948519 RepID=UPI003D1CE30B